MNEYRFRGFVISERMMIVIDRYIQHGGRMGDFLTAVFSNDLVSAISHADDNNLPMLPAFVGYMYNEAPSACWGSREKVAAWIGLKRKAA